VEEEELADTWTSPVKRTDMEVGDLTNTESLTKRRLQLTDCNHDDLNHDATDPSLETQMITNRVGAPRDGTGEDAVFDRKKHTKKAGADSPSLGSAGSREGSFRSQ
jgi:hypothetical protein